MSSGSKKAVVSIDVQDVAWKTFAAEFAKFTSQRKEATEEAKAEAAAQKKLTEEKKKTAEAAKGAEKVDKAVRTEKAKADKEAAAAAKRKADAEKKNEEDRKKTRAADLQHLKDSAKWTADVARNVASTAFSAAKWVAFSAVASGFGLGGLAASAGGARRASQGLGINTGELRAANVNFGKYVDPEAALGNIANAQSDLGKQWIFKGLGQNVEGRNAGDILPEILPKLVASFKAGGSTTQGAQGRGLTELVGIDDLRRLSTLTEAELSATVAAYKKDRESLNVGDDVGQAWQEFMVSMRRAGEGIEVSLIKGLKTLVPFLTQFADGIARAVASFASSGGLQKWIESVGESLKKLGTYLGSKEFQGDVESFMTAIHTMASYLGKLFPKETVAASAAINSSPYGAKGGGGGVAALDDLRSGLLNKLTGGLLGKDIHQSLAERFHNPGNLRVPGSSTQFQNFATDGDGIKALAHQLSLYENRDGLTTIRGIISKYAPSSENNTAAYIANVSQRTGLGADQKIDPTNLDAMVKLILAITKQENSKSNFTDAGVRVLIQNATGGSAQASIAAMTGG